MSEMVERVARVLCIADGYKHPDEDWRYYANGVPCQAVPMIAIKDGKEQRWRTYVRKARAMIEEMCNPTPAMIEAGNKWDGDWKHADMVWRAMCEEALR